MFHTYMLTNKQRGVLYIGVTSNLAQRLEQHRTGGVTGFARRYNCTRLVLAEEHANVTDAIAREKTLKAWTRGWKIRLIEETNPEWRDLAEHVL